MGTLLFYNREEKEKYMFPAILLNQQIGYWYFSKKPIAESRKNFLFFSPEGYFCFRDYDACRLEGVKALGSEVQNTSSNYRDTF